MSVNSGRAFSCLQFSESEPGTPGLGISVFKWSQTQKAMGMSPQSWLSLQRGSKNREFCAAMGKSWFLNCAGYASSSRSCVKPLPVSRTRYGSQLPVSQWSCVFWHRYARSAPAGDSLLQCTLTELFQGLVSGGFSIRTGGVSNLSISMASWSKSHKTYSQELATNPPQLVGWN